jgi:nitrate/nitrite transporter NarK
MAHIDRAFVGMAFLWLMLGMVLGLYIGLTQSNEYLPVHITMLLPGFVVLAVYGAVYRLWPEMKSSGLAKAQFWLASLGALGQVVGAYQFMRSGDTMIIAGASVMAILGGLLMFWLFWSKSADSKSHHGHHQAAY